jgi:hypothetical protein
MLINGCLRDKKYHNFLTELSKLRITSWILVVVTPLISLLIYSTWGLFSQSHGCGIMACVGNGMAAIIIPILVYFVAAILAAVLNFIDCIKFRTTADVYRYVELLVFLLIPSAVFLIPYFL